MHKIVHSLKFTVHRIIKKTVNREPSTVTKRQRRFGFTLIEILVVLSIMAVLAGGLLYSTNNARDKGKDARRKQDLQGISSALVAYYIDHHQYPAIGTPTQLDYPSDQNLPSWIPSLTDYLPKFPKDPLQAGILAPLAAVIDSGKKIAGGSWSWLATKQIAAQKPKGQVAGIGSYSGSPQFPADDGKRISSANAAENNKFENTIIDNPTGTMFNCPDSRSNYIRFPNVSIPTTATNIQAFIVFTPRHNGGGQDDTINSTNGSGTGNIKTIFRAELTTLDAAQVTNGNDFINRPKTANGDTNGDGLSDSVEWNDIPFWWSGSSMTSVDNRKTPNLAPLFQKLISQPGWNANPKAVNIFWMNNGSAANCPGGSGRIGVSRDGQDSGVNVGGIPSTAPILNISWIDTATYFTIACEAEPPSGTLVSPMSAPSNDLSASGSGNNYITSSADDNGASPTFTGGSASYSFFVANPGTYNFSTRVKYNNSGSNSYWLQINTGPYYKVGNEGTDPFGPALTSWHWVNFKDGDPTARISSSLVVGPNTVKIWGREANTAIDKFELSTNTALPTGNGNTENCSSTAPAKTADIKANGQDSLGINNGESANLTWTSTNTTSCTVVPGGYTGTSNSVGQSTGALATTTPYTLSCDGGAVTDIVVIAVSNSSPLLPGTEACNDKTNIYCYRTSTDKKSFVLWAQLENINDQDVVSTNASACANADFTTGTYANLGKPTGSSLNYCIKSPQ